MPVTIVEVPATIFTVPVIAASVTAAVIVAVAPPVTLVVSVTLVHCCAGQTLVRKVLSGTEKMEECQKQGEPFQNTRRTG
jgi:uncharacterized membrane protein (DUF106 family)